MPQPVSASSFATKTNQAISDPEGGYRCEKIAVYQLNPSDPNFQAALNTLENAKKSLDPVYRETVEGFQQDFKKQYPNGTFVCGVSCTTAVAATWSSKKDSATIAQSLQALKLGVLGLVGKKTTDSTGQSKSENDLASRPDLYNNVNTLLAGFKACAKAANKNSDDCCQLIRFDIDMTGLCENDSIDYHKSVWGDRAYFNARCGSAKSNK